MYFVVTSACREGWQLYFIWLSPCGHLILNSPSRITAHPLSPVRLQLRLLPSDATRRCLTWKAHAAPRCWIFVLLPVFIFWLAWPKKNNRRIVVTNDFVKKDFLQVYILNTLQPCMGSKVFTYTQGATKPIESVPTLCQCKKKSCYLQ